MVGLDPHSMRVVKDLLRNQARTGTTVFMSTHTLSLAEEIADRIGVIQGGQLGFIGSLAELSPRTARGRIAGAAVLGSNGGTHSIARRFVAGTCRLGLSQHRSPEPTRTLVADPL